ncbi:hypothetical protein D3C73_1355250 [compost metagenome]
MPGCDSREHQARQTHHEGQSGEDFASLRPQRLGFAEDVADEQHNTDHEETLEDTVQTVLLNPLFGGPADSAGSGNRFQTIRQARVTRSALRKG